jgi:hypothetical protein
LLDRTSSLLVRKLTILDIATGDAPQLLSLAATTLALGSSGTDDRHQRVNRPGLAAEGSP